MSAQIKISQAGLAAGVAGVSRTDGLATGALVTLQDMGTTGVTSFRVLWGPPNDTTARTSLVVTGNPRIWTFSPTAGAWGSYRIELRRDGVPVERRIFGIRSPNNHLLTPALNEQASRLASWDNAGADQKELSENNALDFSDANLNLLGYAGWWRALRELFNVVEAGTGGLADHGVALVKLPSAAAAPSVIGATVNGNLIEMPLSTSIVSASGQLQRPAITGVVNLPANSNASVYPTAAAKSVLTNATNASAVPAFLAGARPLEVLRVNSANTGVEFAAVPPAVVTANVTITQATAQAIVSYAAPANAWAVGTTYRFYAHIIYVHTAETTADPTFQIQNNGVVAASVTLQIPATAGTYVFRIEGCLTCRTTGAGGTLMASLTAAGSGPAAVGAGTPEVDGSVTTATIALDTTSGATIRLTGHLGAVVASNTMTIANAYITPVL